MDLKNLDNVKIDYLIEKNKLIILEFYTSWCPTCKMVDLTIEEFEEKHPEIFILQINVDQNQELANLYKIRTAPTMLFIYQGVLLDNYQGFIDIDDLEELVANLNCQMN